MNSFEELSGAFQSNNSLFIHSAMQQIPAPCTDFSHAIPHLINCASGNVVDEKHSMLHLQADPHQVMNPAWDMSMETISWGAIARIGSRDYADELNEIIKNLDFDNIHPNIANAAIGALGCCGNDESFRILLFLVVQNSNIENGNDVVRTSAIEAFGPLLNGAVLSENSTKECIEVLSAILQEAKENELGDHPQDPAYAAFCLGLSRSDLAFEALIDSLSFGKNIFTIEYYVMPALEKIATANHFDRLLDFVNLESDELRPSNELLEIWSDSQALIIAANIVRRVLKSVCERTPLEFIHSLDEGQREDFFNTLSSYFAIQNVRW